MTSWGVPNEQAPLSIGGDIGILTSNALQIYSPNGERKNTLKLSNKVICSFTTGLKTNKFCLVTETAEGIVLSVYNVNLEKIGEIKDVATLSVLGGTISACGNYVTLIAGLPDYKVRVFEVETQKLVVECDFECEAAPKLSYCPLDWRMIAIQEKQSVTLLTVETFGNNSTVMLVRKTITIGDLEGKESDQISKRTEKIWSNDVDELILNCESSGDHLLCFTSIIWRKKQLLASRSSGDIFSLPEGELVYGNNIEMKNLISLQNEMIIPEAGSVEAMGSVNDDDIIFCGANGISVISKEAQKKSELRKTKNKKHIPTIIKLELNFDQNLINLVKLSNSIFLIQSENDNSLENVVIDIQAGEVLFKYDQCTLPITAVCPANGGGILIAREGGALALQNSDVEIEAKTKLVDSLGSDAGVIIDIQQGPLDNLYYAGTDNGFLVALEIEKSPNGTEIKIIDGIRIFKSELTFLAIDPYGRTMIAASNQNDKVLALSWHSSKNILPTVIGFVSVDGVVRSLSISSTSPTVPMHVLASISKNSEDHIDAAVTFELTPEIMKGSIHCYLNNLNEFDPEKIKSGFAQLPPLSTIFMTACISGRVTCFASSPAQRSIRQIEFNLGESDAKEADFSRSLNKVNSHHVSFAVPFHGLWVASVCRSGLLQITRNINEKISIPSTDTQYEMKFNITGDQLVIHSRDFVEVIQLQVKKETQTRVKEFMASRQAQIRGSFNPLEKYDRVANVDLRSDDPEWFDRQLDEAISIENQRYKPFKDEITTELDDLRGIVSEMLDINKQAIDLEKLDNQEFNLDLEAAEKFKIKETDMIHTIQSKVESQKKACADNASKITQKYWKSLEVGPRMVKTFNGELGISNYAIEEKKAEDSVLLDAATEKRQKQIEKEEEEEKTRRKLSRARDHDDDAEEQVVEEKLSTMGTLTDTFLNPDPIMKSQFKLNSIEDREVQLIFIEDRIIKLKHYFNEQFSQSFRQKEAELNRINENNVRIEQIQAELEIPISTYTPEMDVWERPELSLVVKDEEVKVERVLTDEQQAQLDEERRLEELRRAAGGDNWRDRGLKEMMDGVLEVKKEDILKQDIPEPEFMSDPELHPSDWTDEHKKLKAEYEKKVKQLADDRAKHKKGLEAEVKKLQQMVKESIINYDIGLNDLYQKKIHVNAAIHQEELRMTRLLKTIVWSSQAQESRVLLDETVEQFRNAKQENSKKLSAWGMAEEQKKQNVESLLAEEKVTEKQFKVDIEKQFDVSAVNTDFFFKIYKKRAKTGETLEALDEEVELPPGVEPEVFDWVKEQRVLKMEQEAELKKHINELNTMATFINARKVEEENQEVQINQLIVESEKNVQNITESESNLSIQLLLKQGQVEIDSENDAFLNAIFVHREIVEDLNQQIKQYGQNKIDAMLESKDFRKGIHMLEWERRRLEMEIHDLTVKSQDIQMLKLTRELQSVLASTAGLSTAGELARIDKTLQSQNLNHQKRFERKKHECSKLTSKMSEIETENARLDEILGELHVSVSERRNIRDTHIQPDTPKIMRDIARRRKLQEISRAQQNEIAVLRNELERLRKKTFPALVKLNK